MMGIANGVGEKLDQHLVEKLCFNSEDEIFNKFFTLCKINNEKFKILKGVKESFIISEKISQIKKNLIQWHSRICH